MACFCQCHLSIDAPYNKRSHLHVRELQNCVEMTYILPIHIFSGIKMLTNSAFLHLWRRQVFLRNQHDELLSLLRCSWAHIGIYMIGCADRVVYIGQSNQLSQRSIDSLGRVYHRVSDTSLPWSMALAPCAYEDMDEHESAAIRAYAPEFNTSIPSLGKSLGRMPVIEGIAQIFADQASLSNAFSPECLRLQRGAAATNASPPWRKGKALQVDHLSTIPQQKFDLRDINTSGRDFVDQLSSQRRRAQRRSALTQNPERIKTYVEHRGIEIHIDEIRPNDVGKRYPFFEWMAKSYGKVIANGRELDKATAAKKAIEAAEEHLSQPYRFKINLCDDGPVVTRDGEYLGTWATDENNHLSFTPDGESEVLFFEMWKGMLCQKIADWYEAQDQVQIS